MTFVLKGIVDLAKAFKLESCVSMVSYWIKDLGSGVCECRDYDFEGNPKWQQYKANLEIPVSANRDATVEKLKAKWYRREVVTPTSHMKFASV